MTTQPDKTVESPTAHELLVATDPRVPIVAPTPIPVRKRLFDLSIALPAALVTAPLTLALGAVCAVRYRQSPLFGQPRIGRSGTIIKFWKLRTLPRHAPDTADKYQLRALDLPRFALRLRARHLDELPQLWMVLSGKLSLVGPRPEMPTLSNSFDQGFVAERLTVQPGCTGLWQVSTSARFLIGEAPEFDLHYVRNWTLRLDLWILMRTLPAIVTRREVASLSEIPRWTGAAV